MRKEGLFTVAPDDPCACKVYSQLAIAVHCVLMGDKSEGKAGRYKKWNAGHVFDICL